MFWGMKLAGPKNKVAFMSEEAVRITNLSLELPEGNAVPSKQYVGFYIVSQGKEYLVAQLRGPKHLNVPIDLDIDPEDDIMFRIKGEGTIHLAGYTLDDEDDSDSEDESTHESSNQLKGLRLAPTTCGMPPPNFA